MKNAFSNWRKVLFQLEVNGYTGNETDYVVFSPALQTNKFKINLVSDAKIKCLRMEFYGCQKKDTGIDYDNGKSTFPCYFCLRYVTLKVVVLTIMLGHSFNSKFFFIY